MNFVNQYSSVCRYSSMPLKKMTFGSLELTLSDVNALYENSWTALNHEAANGFTDAARFLLENSAYPLDRNG